MKTFILILVLVTLQNIAKASTNAEFASNYSKSSIEYKELSSMTASENADMDECVNEVMNDDSGYEMDFFESTDSCINEVLGDIY